MNSYNFLSLFALAGVAGIWLVVEHSLFSFEANTLVNILPLLSIILFIVAIVCRRREPAASKCFAIAGALMCAQAARMGWIPSAPFSPHLLWGVAISMAVVTGYLFRRTPHYPPCMVSPEASIGSPENKSCMNCFTWIIFSLVAAASAYIYLYRLIDVPAELAAYGTQAPVLAARLLKGEVLLKDLVLYREMTQEECGHSLPYVLWHALFQLSFGGLSVFAGRMACAVASWLSVLVMFRVGRHLGGLAFGLSAMASYAFLPLTVYVARSELILGFSGLLILLLIDAMFCYLRRPTILGAAILGLAIPLTGYGIANIKMLVLASLVTFAVACIRNRTLRRNSWQLCVTAAVAGVILIPQILNWSQVRQQVRGRGEHLFGGVLQHLTLEDPLKPTIWQKAMWILSDNAKILIEGTFGPYRDSITSLPGDLYVPLLVALGLAIGNLARTDRFLLVAIFAASYFGPLISIPLGWVRLLMLSVAQGLVIGSLWTEIFLLLRSMRLKITAVVVTTLVAGISLSAVQPDISGYLNQNSNLLRTRNLMLQEAPGTIIFFTDLLETSANAMRWNPPKLGRDSTAERPVIVIREESVVSIKNLVEQLNISALILSNQKPPQEISSSTQWTTKQEPGQMWAMKYAGLPSAQKSTVQAIDPKTLGPDSPVFIERIYYQTNRLFLTQIPPTPILIEFETASDYEKVAIVVRGRDSFTAPVELLLDNGAASLSPHVSEYQGKITTWFEVTGLKVGAHTFTLRRLPDTPENLRYVDDIVLIGVPGSRVQ